ncbi:hypothetical protein [Pontibacter ramchanderi]|uniref:SMP-30/gluconolaconase/LRE-like protein n=1 Tax=Pontibacter ramchanderi TaxID=1179743 RepID=A0A2N3UAF2_9BACT|nr:hypothetical protein [Pontibacter ramchanderi]PKV66380.1 hypothetical protein BD749_1506 [Pontibacter ramchanderi]
MLKILAFFIPVLVVLFYFLGRPFDTNTSASPAAGKLVRLAKLPSQVSESSGVEFIPERDAYITHNDAGNKPYLYLVDRKGKLLETIKLSLPNVDWEDLARDSDGNIYIADTGNNNNKRKELAIYKLQLDKPDQIEAIRFTYEDQKKYPPAEKDMNFDVEAIFWQGGKLYLVSKDRGKKVTAKVYELPDSGGQYKAKLLGSHKLGVPVTGAASNADGSAVALVSEGALHVFSNVDNPGSFYKGDYQKMGIKKAGQTEAVAFENENTLVITSEDGGLFRFSLN